MSELPLSDILERYLSSPQYASAGRQCTGGVDGAAKAPGGLRRSPFPALPAPFLF